MKKIILFLCLTLSLSYSRAQVNLVPNASFEQLDSCTSGSMNHNPDLSVASPWNGLFKSGGGCWTFVCNACFTYSTGHSVPSNINSGGSCGGGNGSYQVPRTGNGYVYLSYFVKSTPPSSFRRYAQTPLTTTLTANKEYCVTYYANLSNRAHVAVDELGAYLDDGSISTTSTCIEAIVTPQIKSPTLVFMKDTLNWMKIQGSFVANGTESYITLGNFRPTASTNYTLLCPPIGVSEYYVDDVSVIATDLPAYAGPDKNILSGDSTFIGRPPEIGLECTWYNGTVAIGTGAGLWVTPTITTTYVVQQDICGNIKSDTITVTVGYAGINDLLSLQNSISLFPQPVDKELNVKIHNGLKNKEYVFSIYNAVGKLLNEQKIIFDKEFFNLDIANIPSGLYFLQVTNENGLRVNKKFLVIH